MASRSASAYDRRAHALAQITIATRSIICAELSVADRPRTHAELESAVNIWLDEQRIWNHRLRYSARTFVHACLENLLGLELIRISYSPIEANQHGEIVRHARFEPINTLGAMALALFAADYKEVLKP